MKAFPLICFFLASSFLASAAPQAQLFQVMSSHPHDVKEFTPYIQRTIRQEGRLWLVELRPDTPVFVRKHFRQTDGSDVKHYSAPVLKMSQASAQILDYASRIDVASIKGDVEMLASFQNRRVGSADNQKATAQIKNIFTKLGYSVREYCYRPEACSVVADKLGEAASQEVIMLMGHFDSVGKDFAGADDNASGTAVMMEVARVLKDYDNKKTIRFFATNGEESGLLGAEHYAEQLKRTGEIKNLVLAINMDMVGHNSNGIVELETDNKYEALAQWFAQLASTYTTLKSKITLGAWGSDHVPFIRGGVPTLLTIEDWSTKTPCYHQACDKPATLNYEYAVEIAKLNLAAMMSKDLE